MRFLHEDAEWMRIARDESWCSRNVRLWNAHCVQEAVRRMAARLPGACRNNKYLTPVIITCQPKPSIGRYFASSVSLTTGRV